MHAQSVSGLIRWCLIPDFSQQSRTPLIGPFCMTLLLALFHQCIAGRPE